MILYPLCLCTKTLVLTVMCELRVAIPTPFPPIFSFDWLLDYYNSFILKVSNQILQLCNYYYLRFFCCWILCMLITTL